MKTSIIAFITLLTLPTTVLAAPSAQTATATPQTAESPTPEKENEEPFPRLFIGATGSSFEVLLGGEESTRVKFNLMLGYLFTSEHQVNLSYGHEPAIVESKTFGGSDRYAISYRFNALYPPERAFYLQGTLGAYRLKDKPGSSGDATYLLTAFEIGKNFQIFDDSSFVYSPYVAYEKIESSQARFRIVPIAFGFFFF